MSGEDFGLVSGRITGYKEEMAALLEKMVGIAAISPLSGGGGESKRADMLEEILESWGVAVRRHDYTDDTGTTRSNLVSRIGNEERTLWIIAHIDTVSEGNAALWKSDPFKARVEGDRIYGRGTLDNGQGVISGIFALRALKDTEVKLRFGMGVALVADEELGSKYGIRKLIEEHVFGKDDLILVPDWGSKDGNKIEIAEKGMLWLKITVLGAQAHASTPEKGINAYRQAIIFLNRIDTMLHDKYNASNAIFDPPVSTFEVTKHEKNVDSVNIIPSMEISYLDCRILPQYDLGMVIKDIEDVARDQEFGEFKIKIEEFNREDAVPQTREGSEIVQLLKSALKELRGLSPEVVGIGGGTCAAFFRKKGMQTAVWSTGDDVAHEPNEYANLSNIVEDAKVFAYMAMWKDAPR